MNNRSLNVTVIVCATALMITPLIANAGPLSPPAGPVAPTNKTLAEVEPRIAINATNTPGDVDSLFRIAAPGSYYLTGNITGVVAKHGIEIASSGVTLDLMGFELLGVAGSLDGVNVSVSVVNIYIHNGSVRNWGGDGVDASNAFGSSLRNLRAWANFSVGLRIGGSGLVEACTARSNGTHGISAGAGSTVSGNTVSFNGDAGISTSSGSRVSENTAITNTGDGIFAAGGCTVSGNTAITNTGNGIVTTSGSTVSGNTAISNIGNGINAGASSAVSGNTARSNTGDGIQVSFDCLVLNNNCDSNGSFFGDSAGIHATSSDNRIDGNDVTDNDRGIDVDVLGNLIIRNSASGNTVNYSIVTGNVGFYVIGAITGAVNGSSGGSTVGTSNPWANFSY